MTTTHRPAGETAAHRHFYVLVRSVRSDERPRLNRALRRQCYVRDAIGAWRFTAHIPEQLRVLRAAIHAAAPSATVHLVPCACEDTLIA